MAEPATAMMKSLPVPNASTPRYSFFLSASLLSWRASSAWTELGGDRRVESVAVLDAGVEGLWLTRHEGDPESPTIHLEPVPPSVVWDRVVDLMPHEDRT